MFIKNKGRSPSIIGVWYRTERSKEDFQRLGTVFFNINIIGRYGWVSVDNFHFCFNPSECIYIWWRDDQGKYHRDGWFPRCMK